MAVNFAAKLRSLFLVWVSIGAVVVGPISWAEPTVPPKNQHVFFGVVLFFGVKWRLRREDAQPGEKVKVINVDGMEKNLLIVAKEDWARRTLDQT